MSFQANAGNITIIDDTVDPPVIALDTDEQLFHCTDLVSGSVSTPQRSITAPSNLSVNTNHTILDDIHADADIVLGSMRIVTTGGSQGLNNLGIFNAGGTYVHYIGGSEDLWTHADTNYEVVSIAHYSFIASGGSLILNERVYLQPWTRLSGPQPTLTLLPIRFDFKLFIGTLT